MVTIQDPKTVHPRTSNFDKPETVSAVHPRSQGCARAVPKLQAPGVRCRRWRCSTVTHQACHQALKNDLYISVYIIPNFHCIAQNELQVFGMAYHGFSSFSSSSLKMNKKLDAIEPKIDQLEHPLEILKSRSQQGSARSCFFSHGNVIRIALPLHVIYVIRMLTSIQTDPFRPYNEKEGSYYMFHPIFSTRKIE